jgi:hypothetical protein
MTGCGFRRRMTNPTPCNAGNFPDHSPNDKLAAFNISKLSGLLYLRARSRTRGKDVTRLRGTSRRRCRGLRWRPVRTILQPLGGPGTRCFPQLGWPLKLSTPWAGRLPQCRSHYVSHLRSPKLPGELCRKCGMKTSKLEGCSGREVRMEPRVESRNHPAWHSRPVRPDLLPPPHLLNAIPAAGSTCAPSSGP